MSADLDALLISLYVLVDDLLPARRRFGRPPRISDSELICLAVAQVLLDCPNERRFLRLAKRRLGHLFPYIPGQSGFNKRLRRAGAAAARGDHAAGSAVAVVLRPAAAARLDAGAVRGLTRDRAPLRPGRDRRLRLLPLAQPLVLGLPPLPALLARRAAGRLRARTRQRARACRRRRAARARAQPRPDRDRRQRLRRRRVRAARRRARRHGCCAPTAKTNSPASAHSAASANGSNRPSTRSKTSSRSNATAAAPSPASSAASPDDSSPSPPPSSTTGRLGNTRPQPHRLRPLRNQSSRRR